MLRPNSCVVDWVYPPPVVAGCCHGKLWPEGDDFEEAGGAACEECVTGACSRARRSSRSGRPPNLGTVAVAVEREGHRGMPKARAHFEGLGAGSDHQGGAGVTEVVRTDTH